MHKSCSSRATTITESQLLCAAHGSAKILNIARSAGPRWILGVLKPQEINFLAKFALHGIFAKIMIFSWKSRYQFVPSLKFFLINFLESLALKTWSAISWNMFWQEKIESDCQEREHRPKNRPKTLNSYQPCKFKMCTGARTVLLWERLCLGKPSPQARCLMKISNFITICENLN